MVCCETFMYILVPKLNIAKARFSSTVSFDSFEIVLTAWLLKQAIKAYHSLHCMVISL